MSLSEKIALIEVIVLIITAGITLWQYIKIKNEDIKSRATMIYFQIKDIEKNIEKIKRDCYKKNFVWANEFYKSNLIYEKNLWEANKIYLVKYFSFEEYNEFEKFYLIATKLRNEQIEIKRSFVELISTKQKMYYERQITENINIAIKGYENKENIEKTVNEINNVKKLIDDAIDLRVDNFVPSISNDIISEGLAEFNKLSDGFAFQIIKKLSKIRR